MGDETSLVTKPTFIETSRYARLGMRRGPAGNGKRRVHGVHVHLVCVCWLGEHVHELNVCVLPPDLLRFGASMNAMSGRRMTPVMVQPPGRIRVVGAASGGGGAK